MICAGEQGGSFDISIMPVPTTGAWGVIRTALADGSVAVSEIDTELPEAFANDRANNDGRSPEVNIALWSALTRLRNHPSFPTETIEYIQNNPQFAAISGEYMRRCASSPVSRQEIAGIVMMGGGLLTMGGGVVLNLSVNSSNQAIALAASRVFLSPTALLVLGTIIVIAGALVYTSANNVEGQVSPDSPDYCRATDLPTVVNCEEDENGEVRCTVPGAIFDVDGFLQMQDDPQ